MLKGLNNLFRNDTELKYQYKILVHSLKMAASMPWHSDRVWYHEKATECLVLPARCRSLMIVVKCGTKLAATRHVDVDPGSMDQIVWEQDLGMICTLFRRKSSKQGHSSFRQKKAKIKLMWRGLKRSECQLNSKVQATAEDTIVASTLSPRLGRWKSLASGKLDLSHIAGSEDCCKTIELELRGDQEKPLGILHLSITSRRADWPPLAYLYSSPS